MNEPTYAIIPTNGRDCFRDSLNAVYDQVDHVYVVEGGPDAKLIDAGMDYERNFSIIREPELNISKWWNLGLSLISSKMQQNGVRRWNVVILNDDAIIPSGWVKAVAGRMRDMQVAAACSGNPNPIPAVHTTPGPVGLATRMQGYAFVLAGEKGVRANEQLKWYFSDDHVDWLSRQKGGMLCVPGMYVEHRFPNGQVTPEIQEQIAQDAHAFSQYWNGMRPW
jgi:Glycosyltransferases, probably involved in cell wall biogenesis